MTDLLAGAVVLGLVLTGLVKLVHDAIYGDTQTRVKVGSCVVTGQVVVFLVAASDFASETTILKHRLDQVNVASLVVFGILVAGAATLAWQALGAVRNVGQNEVLRPTIKGNVTITSTDGHPTPL
jgi:hypothetical protein